MRKTTAIMIAAAAVIVAFAAVALDRGNAAASLAAAPAASVDAPMSQMPPFSEQRKPDPQIGYGGDGQTGIWVSGQGKLSVPPDLAMLTLGVESTAPTVSEANAEASNAMNAIVIALKSGGVEEKDIQTRNFNIYPRYEYQEQTVDGVRTNRQILTGYQISNTAAVKIRDLDAIGEIIDEVVKVAGDDVRINNISFTVEDPTAMMSDLREMAVQDAQNKAEHLAELTGVSLGRAIYISESSTMPSVRAFAERAYPAALSASAAPPISGGELDITHNVQIRFAID